MRICRDRLTSRLIEMQSDATPGTLIANAVTSGIDPLTIDEVVMTTEEYAAAYPALPATYRTLRAAAYPSFADQFDLLYHGGIEAWKAAIQSVKTRYPKELPHG